MDCPSCGKKNVSGDECPFCGVVFSKVAALKEKRAAKIEAFVNARSGAMDDSGREVLREGFDLVALPDFSFNRFYSPRLISIIYVIGTLCLIGASVLGLIYCVNQDKAVEGALAILFGAPVSWILFRVWLEKQIVFFRMEEHLYELAYSALYYGEE